MASRNTKPERIVQAKLSLSDIPFTTHDSYLPGTPDIHIQEHSLLIFIHGCYWHKHFTCVKPRKRDKKNILGHLIQNRQVKRDIEIVEKLESMGFIVFVAWECHILSDAEDVIKKIKRLLV